MGCSLETKVVEDLEDRGLYESDIYRVTNLEKFKRLNDIWTAESVKRYNLNSPLKMFNIVEGTPKKIIQGSSYRRDNIVTTHKAFVNKDFFKELQEKYDLANQPADTTVNRLTQLNNEQRIELNIDFDVDKLSNDLNLETNCN